MQWPIFASLPQEDVAAVLRVARKRTFSKGEVVFHRDAGGNVTGFDAGNGRARGIVFTKVSR